MHPTGGGTRDPEDATEHLLDLAEHALEEGDADRALALCREVLDEDPRHAGALFVSADAERSLGDLERAEVAYRSVTQVASDHSPAWSGLALVLFDQLRFDESRAAMLRAIRCDSENAEAYFIRAMLRERRGDGFGTERDYVRAARLDPDGFPRPERLTEGMNTAVIEEAKLELHPSVRTYLEQVAFLVEDVPSEALCREFEPPALPGELLGFFSGSALSDRATDDPWSQLPSTIVLFRRNLERIAWDREQLVDELRITVLHEVGHFLGLDEDDLEARGLD